MLKKDSNSIVEKNETCKMGVKVTKKLILWFSHFYMANR